MLGILRAWLIALVILTVFYWLLRTYFRSTRREALERRFDEEGLTGERDIWVEAQMKDYGRSLKLRLLWLVYILPLAAISGIIYYVNHFYY